VLELKEQDIDVASILAENVRMQLYEHHVSDQLSGGLGALDRERLLEGLPSDLGLDVKKAAAKAAYTAKSKARSVMVQAFAYYRTRDYDAAVKYVNNLVACATLCDSELGKDVKWDAKEEVLDVFGLYCDRTPDAAARDRAAKVLRLAEDEAKSVVEAVDAGTYGVGSGGPTSGGSKRETESIF
jgi:hypothetical protein